MLLRNMPSAGRSNTLLRRICCATMEDASAVDLDLVLRGWFFGTDPVDISLDSVRYYRMNSMKQVIENQDKKRFMKGTTNTRAGNATGQQELNLQ